MNYFICIGNTNIALISEEFIPLYLISANFEFLIAKEKQKNIKISLSLGQSMLQKAILEIKNN